MTPTTSRRCGAVTAVAVGAVLLSACGSGAPKAASLHDQLPAAIRKAGVIRVGTSLTAAPVIFKNAQGLPDGLDPDLAAALSKELGVKLEFQDQGPFANVLPGLLSAKYDIAMSGITDTRERENGLDANGKQVNDGVDFVDYFMAGIGIVVHKGNPDKISGLDDICGKTVVVKQGTVHDTLALSQQKACQHLNSPLKVLEVDSDSTAQDDLRAGQAAAYLTDYPKAMYNAQTVDGGQAFDVTGPQLQPRPYGIALRKSDTALRDVLSKAVEKLLVDGSYDTLLGNLKLTTGAIPSAVVNGSS
ncbi:polar amino acid transport system substrate-binding protein [Kitasatospora sp. MAA4]|uniref:ABC transporter substrate-binding protein n=1 Tax=Kitasatospora sp. MAA4 TaxID=3035093 RepID=UPI0024733D19|nr:ABC transporter substrate-binding protein [Kitasatospora sp. MAA4]MDH6134245.1 polar amino acid transport system substrate-binding protein [Kitasatospora sp. MAA4]